MGRDCFYSVSRFSVDALAIVLFAQSQRGAPNVEHERRFDGNVLLPFGNIVGHQRSIMLDSLVAGRG